MAVTSAASILTREGLNRPVTATGRSTLSTKEDFLQLLTTQMRNQNPLEPLKDSEMMSQLTQFSTVEGVQQLNKSFTEMLLLQQLTQGANLIGKTISYEKPGGSLPGRGVVESVKVENGTLQLQVEGKPVTLSQVRGIEAR